MELAITNLIMGILCTGGLFALCFLVVVGARMVYISFKEKFIPPKEIPPQKSTVIKRKKKPASVAKPVRSIEIDPEQVDKIYVKKIS